MITAVVVTLALILAVVLIGKMVFPGAMEEATMESRNEQKMVLNTVRVAHGYARSPEERARIPTF